MLRIEAQNDDDKRLANQVLCWILYAARPLWLNELQAALAIEPGMRRIDESDLPQEELLASVCAGLVVIDSKSQVVRLCHYSTEEYLKRVRRQKFPTASLDIARTCLTCLLFDDFKGGAVTNEWQIARRVENHNFFEYAAANWGKHIRGDPERILLKPTLNFLLSRGSLVCSIQSVYFSKHFFAGYSQRYPKNLNGLHLAAQFGLEYIAGVLLSQGFDIASKDSEGENALHKAAEEGHEPLVRLLLHHKAELMAEDRRGCTALHKAATSANRDVISLLFEKGATISRSIDGWTALHFAVVSGNEEAVMTLLSNGADVGAETTPFGGEMSRNPLTIAVAEGFLALVKLLVEKGAKVEHSNSTLRSPLQEAVFWGHTSITKMLLELGASVSRANQEGWTPLHVAAWRAPGQVAKLLLDRGADIEALTNLHQENIPEPFHKEDGVLHGHNTPVHLAAAAGNFEVFEILRENGASLHFSDVNGLMPIHLATIGGWLLIMESILDTGFEVDTVDSVKGETALHKAARLGFEDCITLLLDHGANIEKKNYDGQNAREVAFEASQGKVLKIFRSRLVPHRCKPMYE